MKLIFKAFLSFYSALVIIFFIFIGCETLFNSGGIGVEEEQPSQNLQFHNNQELSNTIRGATEITVSCSELCVTAEDYSDCNGNLSCLDCVDGNQSNHFVISCSNNDCPTGCQSTFREVTLICDNGANDDPDCPDVPEIPATDGTDPTVVEPPDSDEECNAKYPGTIFRCNTCIGGGYTGAACVTLDPALKQCSGGNLGHQGCNTGVCCGGGASEDIPQGDTGANGDPDPTPVPTEQATPNDNSGNSNNGPCKCDAYDCGQRAYNTAENKCVPCEAQPDGRGKWNWNAATSGTCDGGSSGSNNGGACKCDAYDCGQKGYNAGENKCVPCVDKGGGQGGWDWGAATDGPC